MPRCRKVAGLFACRDRGYPAGMSSNGTIQGMIDGGYLARAYCHNKACGHHADLDWLALRDRLGPDHGALHDDIAPKLRCSKCGGKAIGIIVSPDPKKTKGMSAEGNAYWAKKRGR